MTTKGGNRKVGKCMGLDPAVKQSRRGGRVLAGPLQTFQAPSPTRIVCPVQATPVSRDTESPMADDPFLIFFPLPFSPHLIHRFHIFPHLIFRPSATGPSLRENGVPPEEGMEAWRSGVSPRPDSTVDQSLRRLSGTVGPQGVLIGGSVALSKWYLNGPVQGTHPRTCTLKRWEKRSDGVAREEQSPPPLRKRWAVVHSLGPSR